MKRRIFVFIILIISLLFSALWSDIAPDLKVSIMKKEILSNPNVRQVAYLYSPGLNARRFVVYIETKDDVKMILRGVDYSFFCFLLKFEQIWRIGEYSPELVCYDASSGAFLNTCSLSYYPRKGNCVFSECMESRKLAFLLDNYKAILDEVEALPFADEEFEAWMKSSDIPCKVPDSIAHNAEIHGKSRWVIVKFPAEKRAGGKWDLPKEKSKWRVY